MPDLETLETALAARSKPATVFFRDDDAGWGCDQLRLLCESMHEIDIELDLAVIPAALDESAAFEIARLCRRFGSTLNFHQHGYAHTNHQRQGRKCEFGSDRDIELQRRDISLGKKILQEIPGVRVDPIFTPPWNRCSEATCEVLTALDFRALSRISGSDSLQQAGLADISVAIDWQKKRRGIALTWSEFCKYAEHHLLTSDVVGVMLHHEHLTEYDRVRLRQFIACLRDSGKVRFGSMRQIIDAVRTGQGGQHRASQ